MATQVTIPLVLAILAICIVIPGTVSAAAISFSPSSVPLDPGGTASITAMIDTLPEGLAGYEATIAISNPGVAEMTSVTFPEWAGLNNVSGAPSASVRVSAIDLNRQVQPGATGVVLGTITIQGKSAGSATINVEHMTADADGGNSVETTANSGSITVGSTSGGGGSTPPAPLPGIVAVAAVIGAAAVVIYRSGRK